MPDTSDNNIVISMLRDQHREILGRITALDTKMESTRVEIKNDLNAANAASKAELVEHEQDDAKKFEALTKEVDDLKTWRAKAVAYGTVFMFILTFVSQAIAGGHFPGL